MNRGINSNGKFCYRECYKYKYSKLYKCREGSIPTNPIGKLATPQVADWGLYLTTTSRKVLVHYKLFKYTAHYRSYLIFTIGASTNRRSAPTTGGRILRQTRPALSVISWGVLQYGVHLLVLLCSCVGLSSGDRLASLNFNIDSTMMFLKNIYKV